MNPTIHALVKAKADDIEKELKRLNRWSGQPLPPEQFENMGAFGSNTMAFEQWLQFVLIPRIHEIASNKGEFPGESNLSPYAVRVFDGDTETDYLCDLLYQLDTLINRKTADDATENKPPSIKPQDAERPPSLSYGSSIIPDVLYTLVDVLPQFSGADLEAQLQTYDMFLYNLSSDVRLQIADLLAGAASKTKDQVSRLRIQKAAESVRVGGRAADPYNHDEAMKKYKEDHKNSFPDT